MREFVSECKRSLSLKKRSDLEFLMRLLGQLNFYARMLMPLMPGQSELF